ncbi:MAG: hypothetical protein ACLP1W_12630 [Rhodomicrobium sp.]
MFFFFPFAAESAAAPVSLKLAQRSALPMLPAPRDFRSGYGAPPHDIASAISEAGQFSVDLFRRALGSLTSSLTALSSRANALFAQVAASLALERAMRDTAASFGVSWPGFGLQQPQSGFAPSTWYKPYREPAPLSPFALPGFPMNPWAANPWSFFTEAVDMWTNVWLPSAAPQRRSTPAPVTATAGFPGFSWSFTLG